MGSILFACHVDEWSALVVSVSEKKIVEVEEGNMTLEGPKSEAEVRAETGVVRAAGEPGIL